MSETSDARDIFSAYQKEPPKRRLGPLTVVLLVFAVGMAFALRTEERHYRIVTEKGIRAVERGMPQGEAEGVLGDPIAAEPGADGCYRYGRLTMEKPTFVLYTVCYRDGRLQSVTPREYTVDEVAP